jgi:L-aminopeptidase/D-esterase-like protein
VPIVPAAIIYDLTLGDPKIRPGPQAGYDACRNAKTGDIEEGSVGAGAGATVGKLGTGQRMKGGIGTASIQLPNGIVVGAIVAVNCVGNVIDPKNGMIVAGMRTADGKSFQDIIEMFRSGEGVAAAEPGANTTIGVVATNAALSKSQITKVAQMAHDGVARAINPAHTTLDGDTLFAVSTATSNLQADVTAIGALAAEAVSEAILRGVMRAKSMAGILSYEDLQGK